MNHSGKLHALLSTARVANVPSVVSNVWVGVAIGAALNLGDSNSDILVIPWLSVFSLLLAGICLYVAGNFLNDWKDREWDAIHRPERALPRGLFTHGLYRTVALVLAVAGVAFAASVNWLAGFVAAGITSMIVVYTVSHKRSPWSVVPMGLCRALLPLMGAFGMFQTPVTPGMVFPTLLLAGIGGSSLFCYIVGLSLSARYESMESLPDDAKDLPLLPFGLAAFIPLVLFLLSGQISWLVFAALIPYILWLGMCRMLYRKPISTYVAALLAGIPLVDWMILLPGSMWELTLNTPRFPSQPLEWVSLTLPPLAFLSALLLQRLAPAT